MLILFMAGSGGHHRVGFRLLACCLKLVGVSCRDLNIVFTFTPLPKLEFFILLCNLCCVFSNLYLDTSNMGLNPQISSVFCYARDCFLTMTNHILLIDLFVCVIL